MATDRKRQVNSELVDGDRMPEQVLIRYVQRDPVGRGADRCRAIGGVVDAQRQIVRPLRLLLAPAGDRGATRAEDERSERSYGHDGRSSVCATVAVDQLADDANQPGRRGARKREWLDDVEKLLVVAHVAPGRRDHPEGDVGK